MTLNPDPDNAGTSQTSGVRTTCSNSMPRLPHARLPQRPLGARRRSVQAGAGLVRLQRGLELRRRRAGAARRGAADQDGGHPNRNSARFVTYPVHL